MRSELCDESGRKGDVSSESVKDQPPQKMREHWRMSRRDIGNSIISQRLRLFSYSSIGDGEGNPHFGEWCDFACQTAALLMGFGRISRIGCRFTVRRNV